MEPQPTLQLTALSDKSRSANNPRRVCSLAHQLRLKQLGEAKGVYLKEDTRKKFVRAFEETLQTTVEHRQLGRPVSYRQFIRLEAYKLIRHLIGMETYKSLRAWW